MKNIHALPTDKPSRLCEENFVKYYEHKFESYRNNKKKLYTYDNGYIFMEEPYKYVHYDRCISYFLARGGGKKIDEETLKKFFKEISRNDFFYKGILHIPTI